MEIKPFEKKVWLASPTMHGKELEYVHEAYETNWMSTVGRNIDELERIACEHTGAKYAVALSCGTAALHLAVKLAGIGRGDRVFCTDMTFAATLNSVVYEGAEPVFIDTEYDTWNMDPVALERAFRLYPDAKAVIIVNLYGTPAKLDELCEIANRYGAVVIEDAAESLGATYKGRQTGTFGRYNAISFNGNKIITGSSGGMLLTDDEDAAKHARKWSTQSRDNAPWYQHTEIGYNYRMSNVIAGIARGQYAYLDEHIARKREIYLRYREGLAGLPVSMNPHDEEYSVPNFWLSCMIIEPEGFGKQTRTDTEASFTHISGKSTPTEILAALAAINAEGRPIWKPMHMQPIYKNCDFVKSTQDGTDVGADIFERGLCLPSDIKMTNAEQDVIIAAIRKCFE
ncbi:MAG: aminotransferase class I/II-fold pyridoxal phosphate-dependent enzyme [Clostridia bacterium]|nr:aminotransferase class I/II-fold pyridoxal phosphate-dependent enzyme [Clostridia bacterium]